MAKIESFSGDFRWLSNFVAAEVVFEGRTYSTVEHAYCAAKSLKEEWREYCADWTITPGKIKREAKEILIRKDWDEIKKFVMKDLLFQKYNQEPFMSLLMNTGDVDIEEGNTWGDTFWGINLNTGEGQNNLGKMIMEIRLSFRTKPLF
jgi:ribA/ribD-fused uncharacterized protein